MPAVVLVHGNPETDAIWGPLAAELERRGVERIVRLSPPGFGVGTPAGWGATQSDYREWLISALEQFDEAPHVLGHDWGAGHVYGAVAHRPDLFRSWAADCGGLVHPDYEWHDAARGWQTPVVGEEMVAGLVALSPSDRAAAFAGLGMTAAIAASVSAGVDEEMGRCILSLYRSASQPAMRELGEQLAAGTAARNRVTRGAVVVPTADAYPGTPEMAREVAALTGARTVELKDRGHWWMIEDPSEAADRLLDFWRS